MMLRLFGREAREQIRGVIGCAFLAALELYRKHVANVIEAQGST